MANGVPAGEHIKRSFILLRRCQLLSSRNSATPEIIRLHMHIADTYILNLLFDETDGGLLQETSRTLLLAAHFFLYLMLRQIPKNGAVAKVMLHRLESSIRQGQTAPKVWKDRLPALLWVLFVGATSCKPPAEGISKHWMWERLRDVSRLIRPASKESLTNVFRDFLWSEKICSPFLDEFWNLEYVELAPA